MTNCIFCRIVSGQDPATRVYEDEHVLAFLDIRPVTRGHTLVIPKLHADDLTDLSPDSAARVFQVGHSLARAVRVANLRADGANLVINDGRAAFQTVGHTHLHVVPRHKGDVLRFAKGFVLRRSSDPEGTAAVIREGLARLDDSES